MPYPIRLLLAGLMVVIGVAYVGVAGGGLFVLLLFVRVFVPSDEETARGRAARWMGAIASALAWVTCRILRIRLVLPPQRARRNVPRIIVSTHTHTLDALFLPVLYRAAGHGDVRWVVKDSLMDVPVVGWLLGLSGCVPVTRARRGGDRERVEAYAQRARASGAWFLIFPEGTRFKLSLAERPDDRLLPARTGGFEAICKALGHAAYEVDVVAIRWERPEAIGYDMFDLVAVVGQRLTLDLWTTASDEAVRPDPPGWLRGRWEALHKTYLRP